jgi:hypothetical protein
MQPSRRSTRLLISTYRVTSLFSFIILSLCSYIFTGAENDGSDKFLLCSTLNIVKSFCPALVLSQIQHVCDPNRYLTVTQKRITINCKPAIKVARKRKKSHSDTLVFY